MQLNGLWLLCADGVVRPVIRGEVLAGDGARIQTLFLIDTGADRTVFSANIFTALRRLPLTQTEQLGGVGGRVAAMLVETQIEIQRDDGGIAVFRGRFAALTDPEALDMSVLGHDISNSFVVIVDRPRDVICLLGQQHRYVRLIRPQFAPTGEGRGQRGDHRRLSDVELFNAFFEQMTGEALNPAQTEAYTTIIETLRQGEREVTV